MADLGPLTFQTTPQRSKIQMSVLPALNLPIVNGLALYVAPGIPEHRQLEIFNGWRFLSNGIRDRFLFPFAQFPGPLFSSAPIDSMTENARLTASDTIIITTPGHVGIGIHENLRQDLAELGYGASDHTNIIEDSFKRLIEFAIESEEFKANGSFLPPSSALPATAIALDAVAAGFVVDTLGTYSVTPVRTPGPVMEAKVVTGSFATVRDLYDEFVRNPPTSWTPYYKLHQDGDGVPYLDPWAVPLEHTSITETWV